MLNKLKTCPFCGHVVARTNCEGEKYLNTFYCNTCPVEFTIPHHATNDFYLKTFNSRATPVLPTVKPDDVIGGEWYFVKIVKSDEGRMCIAMETLNPILYDGETKFTPSECYIIYGPIKFKLEEKT